MLFERRRRRAWPSSSTTTTSSTSGLYTSLLLSSSWFLTPLASTPSTNFNSRELTGRFIHLTDLHPDPFYLFNSSEAKSCHSFDWKKERGYKGKRKGDGDENDDRNAKAGYWGTSVSDCDAPLTLLNSTFDWLQQNFKGKVDFVVWTGDNARHDIDTNFPRSLPEIYRLNRYVSDRIRHTFGKDVPIVTSFGNNDVFPHNIMFKGPSSITNEFLNIWKHYIPEEHLHTFARGGYYSIEAIPNQLLLVSLNTLYFFQNNKAVDGCPSFSLSTTTSSSSFNSGSSSLSSRYMKKKDEDPGTEELLWLEQQLVLARIRKMQVWLTGHVPATKSNWYEGCYSRYGELMLAYQDTIVGSLFGHMNVDHFSFIQASDVLPPKRHPKKSKNGKSKLVHSKGSTSTLLDNLMNQFQNLPKKKKTKERDYGVVNINPSVIPTYLPAVRVWEYNTTIEGKYEQNSSWANLEYENEDSEGDLEADEDDDHDEEENEQESLTIVARLTRLIPHRICQLPFLGSFTDDLRRKKKKKKHHKQKSRRRLPRYSSPEAPGRSNRFLTPLGYTQYYLDLDRANKHDGYGSKEAYEKGGDRPRPSWSVEYVTLPARIMAQRLLGAIDSSSSSSSLSSSEGFKDPTLGAAVWPEDVMRAVEESKDVYKVAKKLREKDLIPYEMDDLTIGAWLDLARKIAKGGKVWKGFQKRMFVSSGANQ